MSFDYHRVELPYFFHLYNLTHLNERMVELAVAHWWLDQLPANQLDQGLEVGNVLGHYAHRRHTVLDLHEPAAWYQNLGGQRVVNVDVLNRGETLAQHHYPWVISISTIEHVGENIEPGLSCLALDALFGLIEPGGRLLVTWPTGVNAELDESMLADIYPWTRRCTISKHVNGDAVDWRTTERLEAGPYVDRASVVFIGEWEAPN